MNLSRRTVNIDRGSLLYYPDIDLIFTICLLIRRLRVSRGLTVSDSAPTYSTCRRSRSNSRVQYLKVHIILMCERTPPRCRATSSFDPPCLGVATFFGLNDNFPWAKHGKTTDLSTSIHLKMLQDTRTFWPFLRSMLTCDSL